VTLRWAWRRWRRRMQRFRFAVATAAGTLVVTLGTVYDSYTVWHIAGLVVTAILCAGSVVLFAPQEPQLEGRANQLGERTSEHSPRRRRRLLPQLSGRGPFRRGRARAPRVVPALPPSDGGFHGRERTLADLVGRHKELRQARTQPGSPDVADKPTDRSRSAETGPVILLIHGKPGVGKTAVAEELARRLAPDYPDGQILVNFGTGGAARTPSEVLKDFLLDLGEQPADIPAAELERARYFRSLTSRTRILFILDAARHAGQVLHVLPNGHQNAVILTSRRDLSADPGLNYSRPADTSSYLLEEPDEHDAMTIFRAVSQTDESENPTCAERIVRMCGRLPAAIRAAAERISHDGTDICSVADLLQSPSSRLAWLESKGRPVRTLILAEYDRLFPEEKRAFALLGLLPSQTFVSWVIAPLMNVHHAEAEALVDRLNTVQLLDEEGVDESSQLPRYRFHGLTRLFAEDMLGKLGEDERESARARLDEAYREVTRGVLGKLDAEIDIDPGPSRWLTQGAALPGHIAEFPEHWARAEYASLVRLIHLTYDQKEYALAWRIGAWLGGYVPTGLDVDAIETGYSLAAKAAELDENENGMIEVALARGTFLYAIERYSEAVQCLRQAAARAGELYVRSAGVTARTAAGLQAAAYRKLGEAFLQTASYRNAITHLQEAELCAVRAQRLDEQQLVQILTAEIHGVECPNIAYDQLLGRSPSLGARYRVNLALAETARRRGAWGRAHYYLSRASEFTDGDIRKHATIQYRMSRLYLSCAEEIPGDEIAPATHSNLVLAIRKASAAVVSFETMKNTVGTVRANCLLGRAMMVAGHVVEAEQVIHAAEAAVRTLQGVSVAYMALTARVKRVKGELYLRLGHVTEARRLLLEAATHFGEHHDWAARTEMVRAIKRLIRRTDQLEW
jgi:tetratricopeptide (TPR) repeat protein